MQLTSVWRNNVRVHAIDCGGGLLRPVPAAGQTMVSQAREAELEEVLGPFQKAVERITLRRQDPARGCVCGGTALRVEAEQARSKNWQVDNDLYDLRRRRDTGWKSHRTSQYK